MVGYGNHIPRFRRWMLDDFLRKLHSIAYRVTKAECLDLPAITEEVRTIQLEPKAQKIYEDLEEDSFTELRGTEVTAANVLTKLLRLSQVTGGHLTDDESDIHQISTAKLEALSDIIDSVMINVTATDIIGSLFNPADIVCFRVFDDKKRGLFQGAKLQCECGKYKSIEDTLKQHNAQDRGVFFVVNYGGQDDESITRINAQFLEMDDGTFEEQQAKIDAFPLKPSMTLRT